MGRLTDGTLDSQAHNIWQLAENKQYLNTEGSISSFSAGKVWRLLIFIGSKLGLCESIAQKCATLSVLTLLQSNRFDTFELTQHGFKQKATQKEDLPESKIATSVLRSRVVNRLRQFLATFEAYSQQPLRDDATRSSYAKSLEHHAMEAQTSDIEEATKYRLKIIRKLLEAPSNILQGIRERCIAAGTLGVNIQGLDENLVADRSMHVRSVRSPEGEFIRADLDLTTFGRQNLKATIAAIRKNPNKFSKALKEKDSKALKEKEYGKVTIEKNSYSYVTDQDKLVRKHIGRGVKIHIKGLGTILVPQDCKALEKRISFEVQADSSKEEETKLAHLMSIVGLSSAAFEADGTSCVKCQKLMTLFRSYYPSQSYALEKKGLSQNPNQLKEQILQAAPQMKKIFEQYKDGESLRIEERGIGKLTYTVPDMSSRLQQAGARALIAGIGDINRGKGLETLKVILSKGALSSKARFDAGLLISGASSDEDHSSGGAGHVFTRMLTQSHLKTRDKITNFNFAGQIQLLFDLDTANAASTAYAYHSDEFGTKNGSQYKQRPNLITFARSLDQSVIRGNYLPDNEVMIKERIPPNHIKGVVVQSQEHREAVIATLTSSGHVVDGKVNGIDLNQSGLTQNLV